jgi:hypothetical protein
VGVVALMLALAVWLGTRRPSQDPVRDHSVMRANQWGTKALAELCRRHGLKVSGWFRPLSLLTQQQQVLCLLDPSRLPTTWELDNLVAWVTAGGTLIVGVDMDESRNFLAPSPHGAGPDEYVLAALGLVAEAKGAATSLATLKQPTPETREVNQIYVPGPYRLRPANPGELEQRNRDLQSRDPKAKPLRALVRAPWQPLLGDAAGTAVMAATLGQGRVYALSEVEILANENLARSDNVVLAANLLYGPGVSVVHFDEHLHWVRPGLSEEAAALDPARAFWALRLALLALALYFAGQMLRFGAPVPLRTTPRRSALEFVDAAADLYRRAAARGAVVEILRQTFRQRLAGALGLPHDTPGPALAAAAAGRTHGSAQRAVSENQLAGLLARLDAPALAESLSEAELLKLTRLLATYEEAVTHGR